MESKLTRDQIAQTTYRWDRIRGVGQGITETCWQVFALLVAIRVFQADESIKQFIPAGLGIGFLLSPLGLSLANNIKGRISTILSCLWIAVAFALAGMTLSSSILPFVLCIALAQIIASQGAPMLTHLYSTNYQSTTRGSRLSTTFLIASLAGIGFGFAGGELLDLDIKLYPILFITGILAALLAAWSGYKIPSETADTLQSRDPIRSMVVAWQDRLFRKMLIGWMLIGLASLMMLPLRVEYLANPLYGINASNAQISALLISLVLSFRLLSTKIWGALFDRVNVVTLRIILNVLILLSILLFFFTDRIWIIAIGCALLGTAFGGGGILWTLYVTKIAPPEKVASYMSVHGFLTGLRMAIAPILGYTIVDHSHPSVAAWLAMLMIGISIIIFIPLRPLIDAKAGGLEVAPNPRNDPA